MASFTFLSVSLMKFKNDISSCIFFFFLDLFLAWHFLLPCHWGVSNINLHKFTSIISSIFFYVPFSFSTFFSFWYFMYMYWILFVIIPVLGYSDLLFSVFVLFAFQVLKFLLSYFQAQRFSCQPLSHIQSTKWALKRHPSILW